LFRAVNASSLGSKILKLLSPPTSETVSQTVHPL
jgi:hypothetical protein